MHDLACVIHLHSTYSDGTGTVEQIAKAGRRAGVDVVLLTDHDTLAAKRNGQEGWYGSVLLLVGEEVSPRRRNHYLAFGIDEEIDHSALDAAGICAAVRAAGGFGFAAHPFSEGSKRFKRAGPGMPFDALDSEALGGIELWSFVNDTGEEVSSVRQMAHLPGGAGPNPRPPAAPATCAPGTISAADAGWSPSAASTPTSSASGSARSCRCG